MVAQIDGNDYFYKKEGHGDPILFIHGNPDSAEYWNGVIGCLKEDFQCIAPDLPGFGRSSSPEKFQFSLEYGAQWLDQFIDALTINPPIHLVVHDIGGFYGLPWAIKNPDKVKSICVHNSIFFSDDRWHFWGRIWRTPILGELTKFITSKWLFRKNLLATSPMLTDTYLDRTYKLGFANGKIVDMVLNVYRAMNPEAFKGWEDQYIALTKEKPVCVIWGENDPYIPPKFRFAERFANGQSCHILTHVGHWAAAEIPEEFGQLWKNSIET